MATATATARGRELEALARRVVAALPADVAREAVLTGSVSRGVADDISDIEMLIVTPEPRTLDGCRELARAAGLHDLDTWGPPGGPGQCVSGYRDGVPIETIWWPLDHAEAQIDVLLRPGGRLELDTVRLAPDGPNVDRARGWLAEALEILRA